MLLDRLRERAALSELLDAVRAGRSGVLVVRGEPGVGKTALLEYAIESAADLCVGRAAGVESEMELAFAALQQLCVPMLDKLGSLPDPQRAALSVAFGLTTGAAPDRFLVGLAALSLLSEAAEQQPLLCGVDYAAGLGPGAGLAGPPGGCRSRSRCCSPPVSRARSTGDCPSCRSGACATAMRT